MVDLHNPKAVGEERDDLDDATSKTSAIVLLEFIHLRRTLVVARTPLVDSP